MDNFRALYKTIRDLENESKNIIADSLKIMNKLNSEESELIEDFIDTLESPDDANKQQLLFYMQEISMEWILDAEKVHKEISNFIIESEGTFSINSNVEACPFLNEVWNGDIYDKTELQGLKDLHEDLKTQHANITFEYLFDRVRKMLA